MDKLTKEQIQKDCIGDVFTSKEFLDYVESGSINSYDGLGYPHNGYKELEELGVFTILNSISSEEFCKRYPYVCWYNK